MFDRFLLTLVVTSFFLSFHNLKAQDIAIDTVFKEEVKVTAMRTSTNISEIPASISVIDKNQIQGFQMTLSAEESMRSVPGVFVNNRYNLSQGDRISIRGLGSRSQFGIRNIRVMQDGIPLTFADGTTQINNLNLSGTGNIEILRGPSSNLYGNGSGGVILIQTELPDTNQLVMSPGFTYGSYGFSKSQLKLQGRKNQTSYFLNSSFTNLEGFRTFSESRFFQSNAVIRHDINEQTRLTFLANVTYAPYLYSPGSLSAAEAEEDRTQSRTFVKRHIPGKEILQYQGGVRLNRDFRSGRLESVLYGVNRQMFNPIFARAIDLNRYAVGTRNVYEHRFHFDRLVLHITSGFDVDYQNDFREEYQTAPLPLEELKSLAVNDRLNHVQKTEKSFEQREEIFNTGLFTSLAFHLNKLTVKTGLRHDFFIFSVSERSGIDTDTTDERLNFSHLSPSAGLMYRWTPRFETFVNYSTAFQTPTANEFSNDPTGTGFNQNLRPETIQSIELGLRKKRSNWQAELTGFYFTVDGQLIPYQAEVFTDRTYYRNAGETENKGIEASFSYSPFAFLHFRFSYTYMYYVFTDYEVELESEIVQLKGNRVPSVPAHRIFGELAFKHQSGISAALQMQWVGQYYVNDFNRDLSGDNLQKNMQNDAYFVTDLRFKYQFERGRLNPQFFAGVNNVFDAAYNSSIVPNAASNNYFEPAAGRNFYVGIRMPVGF